MGPIKSNSFIDQLLSKEPLPPSRTMLMEKNLSPFYICLGTLHLLCDAITLEMQRSLEAHNCHPDMWVKEESKFPMLDTAVPSLPNGDETGLYYAIDFGGTTMRTVRVVLNGGGIVKRTDEKYSLKSYGSSEDGRGLLSGKRTAFDLFDHFATNIKSMMKFNDDLERNTPIGLTFSFPCQQQKLTSSRLTHWTKDFETGRFTDDPVEGNDVGYLLNRSLQKFEIPAYVAAILNDTTGTLLSSAYQNSKDYPPCVIGMILGTGFNACYFEKDAHNFGYIGKVINIELGAWYHDLLPYTLADEEVNKNSSRPSEQRFEKLISGAYLGECFRTTFVHIFQSDSPPLAFVEDSVGTDDLALIWNDDTSCLSYTKEVINRRWNVEMSLNDMQDIRTITAKVFDRSAALAAVAISAIAIKTGLLETRGLSVGVDGSLYVKNEKYRDLVKKYLEMILGDKSKKLHVLVTDDGSGIGAGILASIAPKL